MRMSEEIKRAQLNFEELIQLKWIIGGILALVSIWSLFFLDLNSDALLIITYVIIIGAVIFPSIPCKIPDIAWKIITPVLIIFICFDFIFSRPDIISPLVRMILLITLIRSLQFRKRREDLQLILLCLFMVIVSGVLTLSLSFAIQITVFMVCAMAYLFIINLTAYSDRNVEPSKSIWINFKWGWFLSRIWKVFNVKVIGFATTLFLGVMIFSSIIFFIMPRFQLNQAIPFLNLANQKTLSGFSENVKFGDVVDIILDNSVALRVDVPKNTKLPKIPYWRMIVLDEYRNGSFQMSPSAKTKNSVFSDISFPYQNEEKHSLNNADAKWTFYLEGGISRYLPSIGPYEKIRFQTKQDLEFNYYLQLLSVKNISNNVLFYQTTNMQPASKLFATFEERSLKMMAPIFIDITKKIKPGVIKYPQTTLVLPDGDENTATLKRIVSEISNGEKLPIIEFCSRTIEYLEKNHTYSLKSSKPTGSTDILVRWLDSKNSGHCELFAGGFSLIARYAGYPTRLVAGYKGGNWNGFENYYMIRNSNAHAWCEIYDDGIWYRVDPTPGSSNFSGLENVMAHTNNIVSDKTWRAYLDSLKILWYRRIVNFDEEQQTELAGNLKKKSATYIALIKEKIQAKIDQLKLWIKSPWGNQKIISTLYNAMIMSIGTILIILLLKIFRKIISKESIHPIRKKAGKFIQQIRSRKPEISDAFLNKQTKFNSTVSVQDLEEWLNIYKNLLNLRFGNSTNWPDSKVVFRSAKILIGKRN